MSVPIRLASSSVRAYKHEMRLEQQQTTPHTHPTKQPATAQQDPSSHHPKHPTPTPSTTLGARRRPLGLALSVAVLPEPPREATSTPALPWSHQQLAASQCPEPYDSNHLVQGGWFTKCRGCAQLTSREYAMEPYSIPFCQTCQRQLHSLGGPERARFEEQLQAIDSSWAKGGL